MARKVSGTGKTAPHRRGQILVVFGYVAYYVFYFGHDILNSCGEGETSARERAERASETVESATEERDERIENKINLLDVTELVSFVRMYNLFVFVTYSTFYFASFLLLLFYAL